MFDTITDMRIQALKQSLEEKERQETCEYCDLSSGDVGATINTMGDDFVMIKNNVNHGVALATDDMHFKCLNINYCPMCGRKLK